MVDITGIEEKTLIGNSDVLSNDFAVVMELQRRFSMVERDICAVKPGPDCLHNVTDSVEREQHSEKHVIRQEKKPIDHDFMTEMYTNDQKIADVGNFEDRLLQGGRYAVDEADLKETLHLHHFLSDCEMLRERIQKKIIRAQYETYRYVKTITMKFVRHQGIQSNLRGNKKSNKAGMSVNSSAEPRTITKIDGTQEEMFYKSSFTVEQASVMKKATFIHLQKSKRMRMKTPELATRPKYDPVRASRIIAAAICLRNTAITLNEPEPELDDDVPPQLQVDDGPEDVIWSSSGQTTMQAIIANYF